MTILRDKVVASVDEALADISDGATILVGGFGGSGFPTALVEGLIRKRVKGLTVIANNAAFGELVANGGIRKLICSYPVGPSSRPFLEALEAGCVELELVPQGTLAERIRAGGAGLGGVLTPVGLDTEFAAGQQEVWVNGRRYLVAPALRADFALIKAAVADRWGNLIYRHAACNFNPIMATAANITIAQVHRVVEPGDLDADQIHTPGAFVDRIVVT